MNSVRTEPTEARVIAGNEHRRRLNGWGRSTPALSRVYTPENSGELRRTLRDGPRHIGVRGAGRSYGDAATGATMIDMGRHRRILSFDKQEGVIVAQAGTTLTALNRFTVPAGWLLPTQPGSAHITLGGAAASDVHGKNHTTSGSFGQHLLWLKLMVSSGDVLHLSPLHDDEAFWATVGGMGLTGIITTIALQLERIDSAYLDVTRTRTTSLEETIATISNARSRTAPLGMHAVAWLDTTSHAFRGIVDTSTFLEARALPRAVNGNALEMPFVTAPIRIPSLPGPGLINPATISTANAARWRATPAHRTRTKHFLKVLNPLDTADSWPATFGHRGLNQYQFCVPHGATHILHLTLQELRRRGLPPALAVLKPLGTAGRGMLSFPLPGWTLALDFPARWPELAPTLNALDDVIAGAGGRIYLTKDSRLDPDQLERMYPRLEEWRMARSRLDPDQRMHTHLATRLGLRTEQ